MSWRERVRSGSLVAGLGAGLALLLAIHPLLLDAVLERFGVRAVATGLLLAGAPVALALRARAQAREPRAPSWLVGIGVPLLLLLAAASGNRLFLLLVPAVVHAGVATWFAASLGQPRSLIERMVRAMVPEAPDFIADYCRGLTLFWACFFAANAALVAALAATQPEAYWRAWTGWGWFVPLLAVSAAEFLIRKTTFRYYFHGGPFDRLWSRFFPAERTARGRRSAAHIRRFREQQRSG